MADLAAKDGSQETLVNLVALCCNLLLLPLVTAAPWPALPFLLFLLLAAAHVFANYRAVSCLVLASLNTARLHLLLDRYQLTRNGVFQRNFVKFAQNTTNNWDTCLKVSH